MVPFAFHHPPHGCVAGRVAERELERLVAGLVSAHGIRPVVRHHLFYPVVHFLGARHGDLFGRQGGIKRVVCAVRALAVALQCIAVKGSLFETAVTLRIISRLYLSVSIIHAHTRNPTLQLIPYFALLELFPGDVFS